MSFLSEPEPTRGESVPIAPGIRRVVAPNPSVMTYWGTNTYLIDHDDGVLILDPGPDDASHVQAVLAAAGPGVQAILLSHTHHDHLGATAAMRSATGAPVYAWHNPADPAFVPDVALRDGDSPFGWIALHTPGHASDHICFAGPAGVVFSADHVMGWSSSIVAPPGGNMRDYFKSLQRMLSRNDEVYLPGHGPPVRDPKTFVNDLLVHRQTREEAILAALGKSPQTSHGLMEQLYSKVDPLLKRAAERNVAAHLQKLAEEGLAQDTGTGWISLQTPSAAG